jgi:cell filamentation protein
LTEHSPCRFPSHLVNEIANTLSIVHVELVLIHPFREGNGRAARILATLMAFQAGLPSLDFTVIRGRKRLEYFAAVQQGMSLNYQPMKKIFIEIIESTVKKASK